MESQASNRLDESGFAGQGVVRGNAGCASLGASIGSPHCFHHLGLPMTTPPPLLSFAYDVVAYPTRPQPAVHPERLAALGFLHGLDPAPVNTSRILELGCGDGMNLAAIAAAFPRSHCVGTDLSASAIARGNEFVRRCGLANLELHHADVSEALPVAGPFDFIISHGVYSWVPEEARAAILRQCHESLAPDGLAMVSYNALPGGCARQVVRDMLRWHVRDLGTPGERVSEAKALAQFLSDAPHPPDEVGQAIRSELRTALAKEPGFLYHDDLAEHYAPVFLHEFVAEAGRHGLRFVADVDLAELIWLLLKPETVQILHALTDDRVERLQYFDFLVSRRFHQTVLCRAERSVAGAPQLERVERCWFSASGRVASPEKLVERGTPAVFERPDGARLETDFLPGKLALAHLMSIAPRRAAFNDLVHTAREHLAAASAEDLWSPDTPRQLAQFLLEACGPKIAFVHGGTPDLLLEPGSAPVAFPVARAQAAVGRQVTSAYHQTLVLEDPWSREIVARADGTRSRAQLRAELEALAQASHLPADVALWGTLASDFDGALRRLSAQGLIVA